MGFSRQKKILVANIYREWQYIDQADNESLSLLAQQNRWNTFLDKWEMALKANKEILVIGDINLDFLKWEKKNLPSNDSS